jgi:hypothetical protein
MHDRRPMTDRRRFEQHALNLGKLLGNLQSLEMAARLATAKLDRQAAEQVQSRLAQVKRGDVVEVNALTNADDLTQTLERFNKRAPKICRVDVAPIVQLRDALAHSRVFGFGSISHLRLLKFSRRQVATGKVRVELAEDMTPQWFLTNIRLLNQALAKVTEALDYEQREIV